MTATQQQTMTPKRMRTVLTESAVQIHMIDYYIGGAHGSLEQYAINQRWLRGEISTEQHDAGQWS